MAKFGHKNIAKQVGNFFWKTMIFGNICHIWHHLGTLMLSSGLHAL